MFSDNEFEKALNESNGFDDYDDYDSIPNAFQDIGSEEEAEAVLDNYGIDWADAQVSEDYTRYLDRHGRQVAFWNAQANKLYIEGDEDEDIDPEYEYGREMVDRLSELPGGLTGSEIRDILHDY